MKKSMKKILVALLAGLLCLSMLFSCGGDPTNTTDTTPTTEDNGGTTDADRKIQLVTDGDSQYRIIIAKGAKKYEEDAAYLLRTMVLIMTGKALSVATDDTAPTEYEIVVGANTNRKQYYTTPVDYEGGYCVFTSGNRVIFESASSLGMERALVSFGKDNFKVNLTYNDFYKGEELSELAFAASYQKSEIFNAASFVIVYESDIIRKRMAYTWVKNFEEISSSKYFVEAEMSENAPANTDQIIIKLCDDATVAGGEWELHKLSDTVYEVHASDYYGYTAASKYFKNYVKNNKASEAPLPASATGTICDEGMLTRAEESSKYAFEKTGSIRVMFNNILWGDPMFSQRELYNAALFEVYMPDVLGLQEVNAGRRGNVEEGNGGIIARLAALGYAEAVDPRVKNYYATNEKIPGTDASLTTNTTEHVELNGYGTGGTKVTVNGETFYTAYNCTPLLYNTATTRCIAAEYYWYKNQWDKRTGQSHDNGAGDCASKAATWGLFEDIATGERYIAISTHMCTRSDYIRGLQGAEMVALINELIETYNVPVMLGGDYNGNINAANYLAFVEGGLVNVQLDKLASVYTSPATSHHTYPVYDQDTKLVVPDKGDTAGATNPSNNIDHIMVKNHENLEISVFGVVIDEMSKSGADHLPIFMDFSITSAS